MLSRKNSQSTLLSYGLAEVLSVDDLKLTDEQAQILEMACKQDVMMLTGSAGTGKSQTTKAIIEMLEANNYTYTLLSPTGIAARD